MRSSRRQTKPQNSPGMSTGKQGGGHRPSLLARGGGRRRVFIGQWWAGAGACSDPGRSPSAVWQCCGYWRWRHLFWCVCLCVWGLSRLCARGPCCACVWRNRIPLCIAGVVCRWLVRWGYSGLLLNFGGGWSGKDENERMGGDELDRRKGVQGHVCCPTGHLGRSAQ